MRESFFWLTRPETWQPCCEYVFDDVFDQLVNIIAKIIDKHAPLDQRISRKQRKLAGKPWIAKGIPTSAWKKIQCFELTSLLVIQCIQKLIKYLSKKVYYYSEFASNKKVTCINRPKVYVQYCRINKRVNLVNSWS